MLTLTRLEKKSVQKVLHITLSFRPLYRLFFVLLTIQAVALSSFMP